ncbi:MAG: tRNA ((37)-N6)-dimethylallyltransferase MiaA [Bacteroidota bacterium]|jgi:tRNA dimethylallyltransferase
MKKDPLVLVVQGPTASGKTTLAIELAQHFNTEIISFDSRQFYKEMPIGTAAPHAAELQAVKHHLIQHASFKEPINAAAFAKEAKSILDDLLQGKGLAVMVGGSAMFADALLLGLDELPHDPLVLEKWQKAFELNGLSYLQEQLHKYDPDFYQQIDVQNSRRLMRALEIHELTGKSNLELRKGMSEPNYNFKRIMIDWPRPALYERINLRVEMMFKEGLEQEVQQFYGQQAQYKSLQTVGYSEFFDLWDGKIAQDQVLPLIQQRTRNYAKRQLTWLRRYPELLRLDPNAPQTLLEQALLQIG